MPDCCQSECTNKPPPRTHVCPVNGQKYKAVGLKTVLHHINSPWEWTEKQQGYYFCDDPACGVVYFAEDDTVITKSGVRTVVCVKVRQPDALSCYCFGVSTLEARLHPDIRDFIVRKTKEGMCSCDTSNPSGRCCLRDFPLQEDSSH
jgi:hypothetical protein